MMYSSIRSPPMYGTKARHCHQKVCGVLRGSGVDRAKRYHPSGVDYDGGQNLILGFRRLPRLHNEISPVWRDERVSLDAKELQPILLPLPRNSAITGWRIGDNPVRLEICQSAIGEFDPGLQALKQAFYEAECLQGNWSIHHLQRQIGSLLYERTGLSTDKESVIGRASSQRFAALYRDASARSVRSRIRRACRTARVQRGRSRSRPPGSFTSVPLGTGHWLLFRSATETDHHRGILPSVPSLPHTSDHLQYNVRISSESSQLYDAHTRAQDAAFAEPVQNRLSDPNSSSPNAISIVVEVSKLVLRIERQLDHSLEKLIPGYAAKISQHELLDIEP
jgi:hypothetical protein